MTKVDEVTLPTELKNLYSNKIIPVDLVLMSDLNKRLFSEVE